MIDWRPFLDTMPLVAILRGLTTDETEAVADALFEAGFRCVEVPLNSPDPYDSIGRIVRRFQGRMLVGAGTVLTVDQVRSVRDCGGAMMVSPNCDPTVIDATKAAGMMSFPAFGTASEAFRAIDAGADMLKYFPAEIGGPAAIKAFRAVFPPDMGIYPVGGVSPDTIPAFRAAGASGFGIGSSLYKPGRGAAAVGEIAARFVATMKDHQ